MRMCSSVLAALLFLTACAAPAPQPVISSISDKEFKAIELSREALDFMNRSRFDEAEQRLLRVLYLFPGDRGSLINLAVTYQNEQRFDEAHAIYSELEKKEGQSYDTILGHAQIYLAEGSWRSAAAHFEKGLNLAIERNEPLRISSISKSLAVMYFKYGFEEQARCYSDISVYHNGDAVESLRYARLLSAVGDSMMAYSFLKSNAQQFVRSNPALLSQLALVTLESGREEEAAEYERLAWDAITADSNSSEELKLLSYLLNDPISKDEDEAELFRQDFSDAVKLYWPSGLLERVHILKKKFDA